LTSDLLIKNCLIVTMDRDGRIIENGHIVIDEGRILSVSEGQPSSVSTDREIDGTGKIAIPGLISTHTHMYGILSHGIPISDSPQSFRDFLEEFWWPKIENRLGKQEIKDAARMACVDMAKTGTTCFADILEAPNAIPGALEAEAEVVGEAGLRGFLSFEASERISQSNGEESLQENARFIRKYGQHDGLVKGMMCTHTLFTCSLEFLSKARALASHLGSGIHIHLEEGKYETEYCREKYGDLPVRIYENIGFLGSDLVASQCVHTSPEETELLARNDVKISHMPLSNCEVGGGIAPVERFLDSGLTVSLGTDGYVTDMFEVTRGAFLIHKGYLQDARVLPANQVLEMATISGAKTLGISDRVGSIEPGKDADIVLLDNRFSTPVTSKNACAQLVVFGKGSYVNTVLVRGRTIVDNGTMSTISEEKARAACMRTAERFWSKLD
jgi:cytosine/adenosine deaminase-related metal-dependent hydrolase